MRGVLLAGVAACGAQMWAFCAIPSGGDKLIRCSFVADERAI